MVVLWEVVLHPLVGPGPEGSHTKGEKHRCEQHFNRHRGWRVEVGREGKGAVKRGMEVWGMNK